MKLNLIKSDIIIRDKSVGPPCHDLYYYIMLLHVHVPIQ